MRDRILELTVVNTAMRQEYLHAVSGLPSSKTDLSAAQSLDPPSSDIYRSGLLRLHFLSGRLKMVRKERKKERQK